MSVKRLLSAGGYPSGTSFPVGPLTNDKFYRTDRNLLYFYDGTRWLSVTLYHMPIPTSNENALPLSSSQPSPWRVATWNADLDLWLLEWKAVSFIPSGNSGSAFWTATLMKETVGAAYATSDIANFSTGTGPDTNNQFIKHTVSLGVLLGTAHASLIVNVAKTSTPGTFNAAHAVTYRLVG